MLSAFPPAVILHDVPCAGCVVAGADGAAGGAALPLIVVLHGDEGSPKKVAALWGALAERGVCGAVGGEPAPHLCSSAEQGAAQRFAMLAPHCPKGASGSDPGCTAGSFWRWDGPPTWLFAQVAALSERLPIDRARIGLAGWSGGTTYIGMHAESWFVPDPATGLSFASILMVGGGMPQREGACTPSAGGACAPVRYLMGDKNPYFDLAESTRDAMVRCGHDVAWERLAGADHGAEWRAYERRAPELALWLLAHPAGCAAPREHDAPLSGPGASSSPAASASPSAHGPPGLEPALPAPPLGSAPARRSGCACHISGGSAPRANALFALLGGVLPWLRRLRGGSSRARPSLTLN